MPKWVRCRDSVSGHEFDLSETDRRVRDGLVEVLKNYPENDGYEPRPAKFRTNVKKRKSVEAPSEENHSG